MRRLLCLATPVCMVMSGCASTPEKPSVKAPDRVALEWCSADLVEKYRNLPTAAPDTDCGPQDAQCQKAAATIASCSQVLQREGVQSPPFIHGRFVFGLSTDAEGRVSDLCLIDTNLGNTPDTLQCVARTVRVEGMRFEPDQKGQPWRVTWSLQSG